MKHDLKIWPNYFDAVYRGDKNFEIRRNRSRGFQKGDLVRLREFIPDSELGRFTGREVNTEITYVCNFEQKEDFVVFGFSVI